MRRSQGFGSQGKSYLFFLKIFFVALLTLVNRYLVSCQVFPDVLIAQTYSYFPLGYQSLPGPDTCGFFTSAFFLLLPFFFTLYTGFVIHLFNIYLQYGTYQLSGVLFNS
jgi:hypothetical protein